LNDYKDEKLSLIIPIYNEADHLLKFLELIDKLEFQIPKELVIVDDCSKDSSLEILRNYSFRSETQIIEQSVNQGKGAAIRRGLELAKGSIIGVQDADFEYDPREIPQIIEPILLDRADICFGSRYKSSRQVHRTFHYLINRTLTMMSNILSGIYLSDMETCYKFFRAEIIKNVKLESNRFGFEPEITAKVGRLKVRITEIPISYFPRNYIEGKKITWKDGLAAFRHIVYYNCIKRGYSDFRPELPEKYIPQGLHLL
jgi:glycosyltransferase involved in cell wall biosynthesis